jgi:hypothetical protein
MIVKVIYGMIQHQVDGNGVKEILLSGLQVMIEMVVSGMFLLMHRDIGIQE